jgi:hypothetical protein
MKELFDLVKTAASLCLNSKAQYSLTKMHFSVGCDIQNMSGQIKYLNVRSVKTMHIVVSNRQQLLPVVMLRVSEECPFYHVPKHGSFMA